MPDNIQELYFDLIDDPADPMRSDIRGESLQDLADSIKQHGIINPPTVRPLNGRYEIVAGHRRFAAAKMAGVVKSQFVIKELDDTSTAEIKAHENLFREDVDPADQAVFIGELIHKHNWPIEECAKRMNRSVRWVEDRLTILEMPDYMIAHLKNGGISIGVALQLVQIESEKHRELWTTMAARDHITVREAEHWLLDWRKNRVVYEEAIEAAGVGTAAPPPPPAQVDCERCGGKVLMHEVRAAYVHRYACPAPEPAQLAVPAG